MEGGDQAMVSLLPDILLCLFTVGGKHIHQCPTACLHYGGGVKDFLKEVLCGANMHGLAAEYGNLLSGQPCFGSSIVDESAHAGGLKQPTNHLALVDRTEDLRGSGAESFEPFPNTINGEL